VAAEVAELLTGLRRAVSTAPEDEGIGQTVAATLEQDQQELQVRLRD
jgi:hypothetical protein